MSTVPPEQLNEHKELRLMIVIQLYTHGNLPKEEFERLIAKIHYNEGQEPKEESS
jgi:hypothetical protein